METLLGLDFKVSSPGVLKYEVLKSHFVKEIQQGRLRPGDSLPTVQALVETLGVAPSTVRQAMGALEEAGLITRVQGKGTFVHDLANQRLHQSLQLFAFVVPETRTGFYPSLLHGFESAAVEHQHQAVVCNTKNNIDRQGNAILQLIDKQVAGVAIVPTTSPATPAYQIRQLQQRRIPVVFCHRGIAGVQAPLLALPHEKIGYLAGKHLTKQGHRRVAFFTSELSPSSELYRLGLQSALREAGSDLDEQHLWRGSSDSIPLPEREVREALRQMLAQPNRPTAIFTGFDSSAELIYWSLLQLGMRVPEDISLISVGDTWRETPMTQRLTAITVNEASTAQRAVELLSEMCAGARSLTDEARFELPLELSSGQTVGPVPKRNV